MKMSLVSTDDKEIIFKAMQRVAAADIIENDWEFDTIFGMSFDEFCLISENFHEIEKPNETEWSAINNAMVWLVSYPHGKQDYLNELGIPAQTLAKTHIRLRNTFGKKTKNFLDAIE